MKKRLLFPMVLVFLTLLLGSCGPAPKDTPTTVTVWTYYNGTAKNAFDEMVDEFNKTVGQENNIIVDAYTQGDVNQLADAVFAAANNEVGAEPMPNIFAAYPDSALRVDQLGLVANLDEYFSEEELASYRPEFIEGGRYGKENNLKIIPVAKSSECIFVNKTEFDRFTKETQFTADLSTWEGVAAAAKNYYEWTDAKTQTKNDGKALFGIDSMANFMIIAARQLDCEIYQHQGDGVSVDFPRAVAKKIWDNFYVPFVSGHYTAIGRFRSDDTKTGDLLAYAGSTASAGYFPTQIETRKDEAYPIECEVLPYPCFSEGKPFIVEQGAGMVIAKSDPDHEKAAACFLKWFTAKEQNMTFAVETGYLPVNNECLNFDTLKKSFVDTEGENANQTVLACAKTACKMLETYTLYGGKPFEASYEARKVLEASLVTYAKKDLDTIQKSLSHTGDRQALLAEFTGDKNFEKWYEEFMSELVAVVEK